MKGLRCYFDILNLPSNASEEDIRKAYLKNALKWHPDKNNDSSEAERRFKEVSEAYEVLTNPEKRALHDRLSEASYHRTKSKPNNRNAFDVLKDFLGQFYQDLFYEYFDCHSNTENIFGHKSKANIASDEPKLSKSKRTGGYECAEHISFTATKLNDGSLKMTRRVVEQGTETIDIIENGKLLSRSVNGVLQPVNV